MPAADPRFYERDEIAFIASACFELLLIDAEVLAQRRAGEKVGEWRGRLRQALRLLDRADRLLPGTRGAPARRAETLAGLERPEEAERARRAAARITPTLAADLVVLGVEHYRRDEFKEALQPLASALALQPGHYGAEYLLALCRLRSGNYQEAKEGLTRCLEQRPEFPWPRLLRGYAAMELRQFDEARADYEAVLDKPPDAMAAYVARVNRGVLEMRRGAWGEAVADLKQAVALKPEPLPAYLNLALAHRQRLETPRGSRRPCCWPPPGRFRS